MSVMPTILLWTHPFPLSPSLYEMFPLMQKIAFDTTAIVMFNHDILLSVTFIDGIAGIPNDASAYFSMKWNVNQFA